MTDRPMTEGELQRAVIDMARSFGWGTTRGARTKLLEEAAGYGVEPPAIDGLIYHPRYAYLRRPR